MLDLRCEFMQSYVINIFAGTTYFPESKETSCMSEIITRGGHAAVFKHTESATFPDPPT